MSERKKYYPPDFDASRIPRGPQNLGRPLPARTRQITIRMMAPMSMRCNNCGEYIYKGKKFNARQETVKNEDYLGLRIYRFYIKCPCCVNEISFKTDPANTDYAMEAGATRSFQAARMAEKQEELRREQEEEDERTNPMQALEKRTKESRREMDKLEHLEELRDLNKRHLTINHEVIFTKHLEKHIENDKSEEKDDDTLIFYAKNDDKSDEEQELPTTSDHKFQVGRIIDSKTTKNNLVKPKKPKDTEIDDKSTSTPLLPYSSSDSADST